ncbi:unnamed protein product [Nippostrongylus brasiliensis]|uniref:Secreted protein n=1 Tax=Nippostrongylus brasiliensis TaxID=27835 RepID=A0A0N4YNL8_NIPBR|nr:unnamed protein product [Nippostrongylus brasiliensis]
MLFQNRKCGPISGASTSPLLFLLRLVVGERLFFGVFDMGALVTWTIHLVGHQLFAGVLLYDADPTAAMGNHCGEKLP